MHCVHRKDPKWREYRDCSPGLFSKMADSRVSSWKEDDLLKGALQKYVKQGLKREEAIDFYGETFLNTPGVSEHSTDVYAISKFITGMTLFRLKMLKRLLKRNWKDQESYWDIEACTRK